MIYFIQDTSTSAIKIGFTEDAPQRRLKDAQYGNPNELILLAITDGDQGRESELHHKFDNLRIRGEWFRWSAELDAYLQGCTLLIGGTHEIEAKAVNTDLVLTIEKICPLCNEVTIADNLNLEWIGIERLKTWAKKVLDGEKLSVNRWAGSMAPFSRTQYERMMSEFNRIGLVENYGGNRGFELTQDGRTILSELVNGQVNIRESPHAQEGRGDGTKD